MEGERKMEIERVEMVTSKQCEINERDATAYKGSWKGRS